MAGPIVRASEFLPQLEQKLDPRRIDLTGALALIGAGLFKKVVISSYLAGAIVDPVFDNPGRHTSLELLVGTYGYAVQIYADFSGYTDIAIGIALLLGIRFPPELRPPVQRGVHPGVLAPLAHDAVELAARLPLHPARRQPRRAGPA